MIRECLKFTIYCDSMTVYSIFNSNSSIFSSLPFTDQIDQMGLYWPEIWETEHFIPVYTHTDVRIQDIKLASEWWVSLSPGTPGELNLEWNQLQHFYFSQSSMSLPQQPWRWPALWLETTTGSWSGSQGREPTRLINGGKNLHWLSWVELTRNSRKQSLTEEPKRTL